MDRTALPRPVPRPTVGADRRVSHLRILVALLVGAPALSQQPATTDTVPELRQIMAHPEWIGRSPQRPYWNWDSRSFFYLRDQPTVDGVDPRQTDLWQQGIEESEGHIVEPSELGSVDPPNSVLDPERRQRAFTRDGDLFVRSLESGALRQLTRTHGRESRPFFLSDGRLGFHRGDGEVFARDLITGLEEQIFDLETAKSPEEKRDEERRKRDYVARNEPRLIGWLADADARWDLGRQREEARLNDPSKADRPWYLGDGVTVRSLSASPDGRFALAVLADDSGSEPQGKMPTYVADSGDVEVRDVRPKVAERDRPTDRLVLLDRETHELLPVDLGELPTRRDDPLEDLREAARQRQKQRDAEEEQASEGEPGQKSQTSPGDDAATASTGSGAEGEDADEDEEQQPRPVTLTTPLWSPDGDFAVVQAFSQDNKDRWIVRLTWPGAGTRPADASKAPGPDSLDQDVVHHQHDPAWINWSFRDVGLIPESDRIYFLSEASGFSNLYLVDALAPGSEAPSPGEVTNLTEGSFVVDSPVPDHEGRFLYYTSNQIHPGRYEVYRIDLETLESEQVTDLGGLNSFALSPDGQRLLVTHSTVTRPAELWIVPADPDGGVEPDQLTSTVSDEFLAVEWTEPRIVEIPSSHQERPIHSRLYLPEARPTGDGKRPAVVFVHGAGYLQNAHMGWSGYFREFMFHSLLTELGYVVLDMDYRASKGYGRDWRTAIYRQMGTPEVEDLQDGVQWLVDNHGVDPDRVGVYGGSYGGFLTFMSLFKEPGLFAAGAALRPVTDWAHYNHPYTSNILNTPELDPEAYRRSSPIEFAEGLEDPLLIASGMLDDNVFFQDSVRLVQRLIELGKEDWELAVYPVEPHGFREPESWFDEYRRILELFEEHVRPDPGS